MAETPKNLEIACPPDPTPMVISPHITYADLAVILLTATGVIVAVMAVIIGIFAIIGWRAIQGAAARRAEVVGKAAVDSHLKRELFDGKLKSVIEAAVSEQIKATVTITLSQASGGSSGSANHNGPTPFQG